MPLEGISGRPKVRFLSSGLACSSTGRVSGSRRALWVEPEGCRFKSCHACCGHCIMAVHQIVDLKVRVRFPLVTLYCRRLTEKPPHYGCGTGGSSPPGSAVCIAQLDQSASLRRKRPWVSPPGTTRYAWSRVPLQISVLVAKWMKARVF